MILYDTKTLPQILANDWLSQSDHWETGRHWCRRPYESSAKWYCIIMITCITSYTTCLPANLTLKMRSYMRTLTVLIIIIRCAAKRKLWLLVHAYWHLLKFDCWQAVYMYFCFGSSLYVFSIQMINTKISCYVGQNLGSIIIKRIHNYSPGWGIKCKINKCWAHMLDISLKKSGDVGGRCWVSCEINAA